MDTGRQVPPSLEHGPSGGCLRGRSIDDLAVRRDAVGFHSTAPGEGPSFPRLFRACRRASCRRPGCPQMTVSCGPLRH